MKIQNPRLRLLLGTQWRLIVATLLVVAVLSFAGVGLSYGEQPTDTVTQQTNQQEVRTTTNTSAVVVQNGTVWPNGTVLEDKPVYLLNATPGLDATAETTVQGADTVRVRHVWSLRIRVTTNEETFYAERAVLANESSEGTTVTTTTAVDVQDVRERMIAIREGTASAGTVTATLALDVQYCTEPGDGCAYTGTETYTTPLTIGEGTYAVRGDMGDTTSHSSETVTEVAQPRDGGSLLALGLAGLAALGLAGAVWSQDPDEIDVEKARIDLHSTQYEQWISPGVIPMGISQQFVELESIEDVVDVAIDTNERVVFDRRRDLYAVISENVVYYFSTGGSWMESAFGRMNVPEDGDGAAFDSDVFGGASDPPGDFGYAEGGDVPFDQDVSEGEEAPFGEGGPFDDDGGPPEGEDSPFDGGSADGSPFGDDPDADSDADGGPFGDDPDADSDADGGPFEDADGE
jgi:hypothetical protein